MAETWSGVMLAVVGSLVALPAMSLTAPAHAGAAANKHRLVSHATVAGTIGGGATGGGKHARYATVSFKHTLSKSGKARYARAGGGGLQCVTFARAASGIALKGNAANWWDAAAGVYQRGSEPEPGSVLNFRANGHMRLGHVAVVTSVVGQREIEIDHANWASYGKGNVSRGVRVIDVSADNDWSAVRVALAHDGDFGSVYSAYGFIYDRPDDGVMVASDRPRYMPHRATLPVVEVAEAPNGGETLPRERLVPISDGLQPASFGSTQPPMVGTRQPPMIGTLQPMVQVDAPDRSFR